MRKKTLLTAFSAGVLAVSLSVSSVQAAGALAVSPAVSSQAAGFPKAVRRAFPSGLADSIAKPQNQKEPVDEQAESLESLQYGSLGEEVRAMQQALKDLGYTISAVDGSYGPQTKQAVTAFQSANDLEADGIADTETLKRLYSGTAGKAPVYLVPGAKSDLVKDLQQQLSELGYLSGPADGSYGPATVRAVKKFQFFNDLPIDGYAGPQTQKKLARDPVAFDPDSEKNLSDVQIAARGVLDQVGWDLYDAYRWAVGMNYDFYREMDAQTSQAALYSFQTHSGNCMGMAAAFCWMARELGYEAEVIKGQVPYRRGGYGDHAWVEIQSDDATWVCDPDFEKQIHRNGFMLYYGQSGTWQYIYEYIMED